MITICWSSQHKFCRAALRSATKLFVTACFLILLSLSGICSVQAQDFIEVEDIGDIDFGIWSDSGSYVIDKSMCIASANTSFWFPWRNAKRQDYNLKVTSLADTGSHYLYRDGNPSATGNERIAVEFIHRDLLGSGGQETLQADQFDQIDNEGQFRYCFFNGLNAQLTVRLPEAQLGSSVNGEYSGNFRLLASNDDSVDSITFSVSVIVQGGTEVRISRLDDLNLGSYGAGTTGDLVASEHFCIYSGSGDYNITITSANQGIDGLFALVDPLSGDSIPLSVAFNDMGTGVAFDIVDSTPMSGTGNSNSEDCGGVDNTTLTITAQEQDIRNVSSGNFSESLMLLVQPE